MRNKILKIAVILILLFSISVSVFSLDSDKNIAFLSIKNKTIDPRYDYLEGIIKGILLYDLSNANNINIVERSQLDNILQEQKLQLTGLTQNNNEAIKIGKLLNADFLLKGDYVFLGNDVLVNINLIDVETASILNFTDRGSTENMIHSISEHIIERLSGVRISLQNPQQERSIISLRDEKPGLIYVYSHLIDAEIFLDEEFVGYTTGKKQEAFEIENVSSGYHFLSIKLGGFGMVKIPEFTFHIWEKQIKINPGKKHTIKADVKHFNTVINRNLSLLSEKIRFKYSTLPVVKEHEVIFQDRDGQEIKLKLNISLSENEKNKSVEIDFNYNGDSISYKLPGLSKNKIDETTGLVRFRASLNKYDFAYSIYRNDIYTNMYRK